MPKVSHFDTMRDESLRRYAIEGYSGAPREVHDSTESSVVPKKRSDPKEKVNERERNETNESFGLRGRDEDKER